MKSVIHQKRPRSSEDAHVHPEVYPAVAHAKSLEVELGRLGCLPTPEDPVCYRGPGKNGFGLFLYLETGIDLQTLGRLADSRDRAAMLRRIASED
jgi:hypothetical protein